MQKVVFKRAIPFQTKLGTILTDTIIIEHEIVSNDDVVHVIAVVDKSNGIIPHDRQCVFNKNKITHAEPFSEQQATELPGFTSPRNP